MTVSAVPNPQGLLVRYTQTASGWCVTSTLSKQLSIGLTFRSSRQSQHSHWISSPLFTVRLLTNINTFNMQPFNVRLPPLEHSVALHGFQTPKEEVLILSKKRMEYLYCHVHIIFSCIYLHHYRNCKPAPAYMKIGDFPEESIPPEVLNPSKKPKSKDSYFTHFGPYW